MASERGTDRERAMAMAVGMAVIYTVRTMLDDRERASRPAPAPQAEGEKKHVNQVEPVFPANRDSLVNLAGSETEPSLSVGGLAAEVGLLRKPGSGVVTFAQPAPAAGTTEGEADVFADDIERGNRWHVRVTQHGHYGLIAECDGDPWVIAPHPSYTKHFLVGVARLHNARLVSRPTPPQQSGGQGDTAPAARELPGKAIAERMVTLRHNRLVVTYRSGVGMTEMTLSPTIEMPSDHALEWMRQAVELTVNGAVTADRASRPSPTPWTDEQTLALANLLAACKALRELVVAYSRGWATGGTAAVRIGAPGDIADADAAIAQAEAVLGISKGTTEQR